MNIFRALFLSTRPYNLIRGLNPKPFLRIYKSCSVKKYGAANLSKIKELFMIIYVQFTDDFNNAFSILVLSL